ncbi:winged helix-turn-helix domain-containing protein [Streptomyces flavofungini]|uniref:winged helix-turn-helix domain-containing protein n=1 Tax=Streptomyces flavofungini TaxID=68200 RepID=UPI0025AF4437|nr:winged helix-turn-helix domain-containing protein [Streptomyces flavofungini]WJV51372.1 winged helix-turn-helix domain-containing protein [Streptomyces flavofungini]
MVVTKESGAVNGSRKTSPQDIADALRDRIRTGTLKAGDRLPTQAQIAQEFGVERGTVRQALLSLQRDGLLNHISRGSPPRVAAEAAAPSAGPAGQPEPQPSMVALQPRLMEAFRQQHVRIDAVSYTAETLMNAVTEPIRQIHQGRLCPESIAVRILLPSSAISLAFPVPVEAEDERDRVRLQQRWLSQRNAQGQVLRHNLTSLRQSHDIDVRVTFRALPLTTPVKLYLLNKCEALLAYYTLESMEVPLDGDGGESVRAYDAGGLTTTLFPFLHGDSSRDSGFVQESQRWFDALWETITTDLTLS